MMYIFYIIIAITGMLKIIDGVRCFTESGRKKLIQDKKNLLVVYEGASNRLFLTKGFAMTAIGLLFICLSFAYAKGL